MSKLKSRKLWIAIGTAVFVILNEGLGIGVPKEIINWVINIILVYILGQSAVDFAGAIRKK